MIYIIDHEDSFTWNVVHQFSTFDEVYCSNYFEIDTKKLNKANTIVFSPGPGSPSDYPQTSKIYKRYKGKKKILTNTTLDPIKLSLILKDLKRKKNRICNYGGLKPWLKTK